MTSRKIALRENIATLPTLLNCFYYFMYRTKSGPHMLTYFKSTKPILSRQTWKIQKCIFQVWRGILLVVNFFAYWKNSFSCKAGKDEERKKSFLLSYDTSIIPKFNAPRKWYEKSKQKGRDGSGNPIGLEKRITWNRFYSNSTVCRRPCITSSRVLPIAIVAFAATKKRDSHGGRCAGFFLCARTWF